MNAPAITSSFDTRYLSKSQMVLSSRIESLDDEFPFASGEFYFNLL